MDCIVRTITFAAAIAVALGGPARAGAPLGFVEQMSRGPTLASVLKAIMPAVISIRAEGHAPQATNATSTARQKVRLISAAPHVAATRDAIAVGSGVVIDAEAGLIVTNNHVIDRAERIVVTLADNRELDAVVVGRDPDIDVAVIRVDGGNLTAIRLGDSDALEVGDTVLAIGNPSLLGQTVTSGIVGGLHRRNMGIKRYEDFIQTDAAIYPGNSGGALVNLRGDLVGISTAFVGPGNTNSGIGLAIPLKLVRAAVDQILWNTFVTP
jgi:serine protease DegQ